MRNIHFKYNTAYTFCQEYFLKLQYEICAEITDTLQVGKMKYSAVVVTGCETLRRSTFKILEKYQQAGGKIIFVGDVPKHFDTKKSDDAKLLYDNCKRVQFNDTDIISALDEERIVDI